MSITMILAAIAPFLLIGLQLYAGCAVVGWTGDFGVVEREKNPGAYWTVIGFHTIIAAFFALLMYAVSS